jgi:hypothetical protein
MGRGIFLWLSVAALAEDVSPAVLDIGVFSESIREGKAVDKKPAILIQEMVGVTLGKTTFAEARAKLGSATVSRLGTAEEAAKFICYRSPAGALSAVVLFVSNSLDQDDLIDEIAFGNAKGFPSGKEFCMEALWVRTSSLRSRYVWLGMDTNAFRLPLAGQISFANDHKVVSSFVSKTPLNSNPNDGDPPYEVAGVAGFFDHGQLIFFRSIFGAGVLDRHVVGTRGHCVLSTRCTSPICSTTPLRGPCVAPSSSLDLGVVGEDCLSPAETFSVSVG